MRPPIADVPSLGALFSPPGNPAFVGGAPGAVSLLLIQLVGAVILLWMVSVVVRTARDFADGYARGQGQDGQAREDLRLALARGEITEEEFERRRELLVESDPRPEEGD